MKENKTKAKIIYAPTIDRLNDELNNYLNNGWTVLGDVHNVSIPLVYILIEKYEKTNNT